MHQIFKDARDKDIRKRYADGLKPAAIARALDVSRQLVELVLKREGLHMPYAERIKERNKTIRQDYAFGMTMRHVAAKYDLSVSTIHNVIHKEEKNGP